MVISIVLLGACSSKSESKSTNDSSYDYNQTNSEVKEANNSQKAEFIVLAKKEIKKLYQIDNFEIDDSSDNLKVNIMPDDKSQDGSETYKNVFSGISNFTYQDKIYSFDFIYSKTDENHYKVLYLYSNYDANNKISVPLDSDK
ncbi:hypothetical protein HOY36_12320 [Enterococcus sp. MMGLQ5-2]|nr:hypothetical protein [Enterococcus sp. MMGLQ5-2]MBS7585566.1 hypothetical protein [Enterococcus sp. MMGLQ5-1]NPD13425.1 hypothetical protein [Enterococcus sp. MMGLQ5-1]NPD38160.1 hypothetical protein [Enterococcus sp. MMGLQ5-2]